MTNYDNQPDAFASLSGEYISGLGNAIASYVPNQIADAEALLISPEHKLISHVQIDDNTVEVTGGNIHSVEPAEESGHFLLHFKEEIAGHKGRTAVITGAAVLAIATSVHVVNQKKRKSR